MKIFGIFILIAVMANPVFATEEHSVAELKTLADKFAVCYGTYGGYAATQINNIDLAEIFNETLQQFPRIDELLPNLHDYDDLYEELQEIGGGGGLQCPGRPIYYAY